MISGVCAMPLIRPIDDLSFLRQMDILDHRDQCIRELANVILPVHDGFESVWTITNRVYDLHCSPRAAGSDRSNFTRSKMTALSA
jgi:hypothetical protein